MKIRLKKNECLCFLEERAVIINENRNRKNQYIWHDKNFYQPDIYMGISNENAFRILQQSNKHIQTHTKYDGLSSLFVIYN